MVSSHATKASTVYTTKNSLEPLPELRNGKAIIRAVAYHIHASDKSATGISLNGGSLAQSRSGKVIALEQPINEPSSLNGSHEISNSVQSITGQSKQVTEHDPSQKNLNKRGMCKGFGKIKDRATAAVGSLGANSQSTLSFSSKTAAATSSCSGALYSESEILRANRNSTETPDQTTNKMPANDASAKEHAIPSTIEYKNDTTSTPQNSPAPQSKICTHPLNEHPKLNASPTPTPEIVRYHGMSSKRGTPLEIFKQFTEEFDGTQGHLEDLEYFRSQFDITKMSATQAEEIKRKYEFIDYIAPHTFDTTRNYDNWG